MERISGVAPGTPANGHVSPDVTVGAGSASRGARVDALVVLAGLLLGAVAVRNAVAFNEEHTHYKFDSYHEIRHIYG